jgi:hypothetical protein
MVAVIDDVHADHAPMTVGCPANPLSFPECRTCEHRLREMPEFQGELEPEPALRTIGSNFRGKPGTREGSITTSGGKMSVEGRLAALGFQLPEPVAPAFGTLPW